MKPNFFTITINIDDFIQYIINDCDNMDCNYNDVDISNMLMEYMENEGILDKPISKFNNNSLYNYIMNTLEYKQENKDILNEIEYHKNKIIELENKLK